MPISTPLLTPTTQSLDISTSNSNTTNQTLTIDNNWFLQQGLLVESITPPMPIENNHPLEHDTSFPTNNSYYQHSVIIITSNNNYSASSLISYVYNCLSNVFHTTIISIDNLINYQYSNTSYLTYIICFDHFNSTIQQTLNSTILHHFNTHTNYLFLII